jgi:polyhydroxybutyrate depolymerase
MDRLNESRRRTLRRYNIYAGGEVRTYCLHLPAGYHPGRPAPLVVNLHGIGANAAEQARLSGMSRKADAAGFVVAYPEALNAPATWNIELCATGPDDLAFLDDLLGHLCARFSIDPARIYATGFSNGAGMTALLGCQRAELFAAIGPVAGAYPPWGGCRPTCPAPMVAFHGTADRVVPYHGLGRALPSIRRWAAAWAVRSGCDPLPICIDHPPNVTEETWHGPDGAAVTLYTIHGGGHEWPRPAAGGKINTTDLIWEFFQNHPMG